MAKDYLELVRLQSMIKEGVEDLFPGKLWVKAEIGQWNPRAGGHCYLSLIQSRAGKVVAEARAMIWKWHFLQLKEFFEKTAGQPLGAGLTVLVRVQVNFSELYGISLFIDDIDPAFTLGEKALERKRAIERLTAGGYMDMQKELVLPQLPYRLAVISSRTAAGYGDFCKHLLGSDEGYAFEITLFEALMQGESAPASIISALISATESKADAILILRGGGSDMDLSCFDDFDLAVAIATTPFPVITAIGHERDVHIADMVANSSVKTPTALADLFLDRYAAEDAAIDELSARIARAMQSRVHDRETALEATLASIRLSLGNKLADQSRLTDLTGSRIRVALGEKSSRRAQDISRVEGRIRLALSRKASDMESAMRTSAGRIRYAAGSRVGLEMSRVALQEALIAASDPRKILSMGYVLVTGDDNKVLKTAEGVRLGERIGVRFSDGTLRATVTEVRSEHQDNNKVNIA